MSNILWRKAVFAVILKIENNNMVEKKVFQKQLKVQVGNSSVQGNSVEDCMELVKCAQKLAKTTPNEFSFFGLTVKSRTLKNFGTVIVIGVTVYLGYKAINMIIGEKKSPSTSGKTPPSDDSPKSVWPGDFYTKYPMPELPPIMQEIINGTPAGTKDAMLFLLINAFATFCYSKVRARYLDNEKHAPNIMVFCEGKSGSGKGSLINVINVLFKDIIDNDLKKLSEFNKEEGIRCIIQYIGGKITESKLHDILANNDEVHMFVLCEEIIELEKRGITKEIIRKALGNEETSRNNKSKNDAQGIFKVYSNMFLAGTPESIRQFFPARELEGGTNSRFIWTDIPLPGRIIESPKLPNEERLKEIRFQIDKWHNKYCYKTDEEGNEKAVDEVEIDLRYVSEAIKKWLDDQWCLCNGNNDCERNLKRARYGSIAFNCAIVIHMMYNCPTEADEATRKKVVELTIYIANYCMERYLYKFDIANFGQPSEIPHSDCVGQTAPNNANGNQDTQPKQEDEIYCNGLSKSTVIEMAKRYDRNNGHGYKTVGRDFRCTKKNAERALKKLRDELKNKPQKELAEWEQSFLNQMGS